MSYIHGRHYSFPLYDTGIPMPHSINNGAAVQRVTDRDGDADHPDVEASPLVQLFSVGCETSGR